MKNPLDDVKPLPSSPHETGSGRTSPMAPPTPAAPIDTGEVHRHVVPTTSPHPREHQDEGGI